MIKKYESSWEYDCSSTPEAWTHNCYMLVNFVEGLKIKINELVDAVNKQQQQLNNHMCRLVILEHPDLPDGDDAIQEVINEQKDK